MRSLIEKIKADDVLLEKLLNETREKKWIREYQLEKNRLEESIKGQKKLLIKAMRTAHYKKELTVDDLSDAAAVLAAGRWSGLMLQNGNSLYEFTDTEALYKKLIKNKQPDDETEGCVTHRSTAGFDGNIDRPPLSIHYHRVLSRKYYGFPRTRIDFDNIEDGLNLPINVTQFLICFTKTGYETYL